MGNSGFIRPGRGGAWLSAVALAAFTLLASALSAAEGVGEDAPLPAPLLPGVGAHDPRTRLDPAAAPWRAVGKLQGITVNLRQTCTASLVGPALVLTAAHCVFNRRTRQNFLPGSLHFLIGYEGGVQAAHAVGVAVETGPGYDPARPRETMGSDWALISLDTRLGSPDRRLPIYGKPMPVGSMVMLGGYQQDHPLVLMADTGCRIVGHFVDASGRRVLRHNCTGARGISGAPLLIEKDGKWYVAGVDVTAEPGVAAGFAVVPDDDAERF
jgi:protease YdgD